MKPIIHLIFCTLISTFIHAQITSPALKANFGVDADLRANYFNNSSSFFTDDWFKNGTFGNDVGIIDTTGAASILSRYSTDAVFRRQPFFRKMAFPQFSVMNNRLLMDAIFIREFHGDDSTVFASGSNKNAMSPVDWSCPISQQIPDKNDILDVMMHLRRSGPNSTDSLWMFGGISIENTTGNRYFDFEMFQTDLYYNRGDQRFYNYGPDAGHTAWQFDAAGNIIRAGDIILTAEYSSSSLSFIEARIWINRADLSKNPAAFSWSGQFDGASSSSQYGYASIQPKTSGAFYTGLQSGDNVWAGPFGLIRENNTLVTNYIARQYMEFSVNLSKLGLDPINLYGGNVCSMPFRKVMVKTRASTSFTAELKDFVGPFDLFQVPSVQALADVPLFCGQFGISNITITNPVASSTYTWSTMDGHIVGSTSGTSIVVDRPGMYVVSQQLLSNCGTYARDTIFIYNDITCEVLSNDDLNFKGQVLSKSSVQLSWQKTVVGKQESFEVERSIDGKLFKTINHLFATSSESENKFLVNDDISQLASTKLFYRLKITSGQNIRYSKTIQLDLSQFSSVDIKVFPNPAVNDLKMILTSSKICDGKIIITNMAGIMVHQQTIKVKKGSNQFEVNNLSTWPAGTYFITTSFGTEIKQQKIVVSRNTLPPSVLK